MSEVGKETVVVTHGIWMTGVETWFLRQRLERAGFNVQSFTYRSISEDVPTNARRLAEFCAEQDGPVHLVGHSLGGIVMLAMVDEHPLPGVGRLVCLGSPLAGSAAARAIVGFPGGHALLGKAQDPLLTQQRERWSGEPPLGVIAGSQAIGVGMMLTQFAGPNDGTVGVEETKLPGLNDHIVLPVSHFSMLWSETAAAQVIAFLRRGCFNH